MKCELGASGFSCPGRIRMCVLGSLLTLLPGPSSAAEPGPFRLEEATIPDLQKAMEDGIVTSERLVGYIRIQGLGDEPAGEGRGFDLDAVGVLHLALCPPEPPVHPEFRRGDTNDDGKADISDPIHILGWLFLGTAAPGCVASANVNGDGAADISDAVYLLSFLFLGSPAPAAPFPGCGPGMLPSDEILGCKAAPKQCGGS